ncbi:MAG: DUF169 domain-containing protein [Candidatus Korarchaeum sp.]
MHYRELSSFFDKSIKQRGNIVGFKAFKEVPDELLSYEESSFLALCQVIKAVNIYGFKKLLPKGKKQACWFGELVLGFSAKYETLCPVGAALLGEERMKKLRDDLIRVPIGSYNAIFFAPLQFYDSISMEPDGVIFTVNSAQAMTLIWALYLATLEKPNFSFNGNATCEIVAALLQGKSPWLTLPCPGAKALAACQDDEVWVGMSYSHAKLAADSMSREGIHYPMPLEQSVFVPPLTTHPLTALITETEG